MLGIMIKTLMKSSLLCPIYLQKIELIRVLSILCVAQLTGLSNVGPVLIRCPICQGPYSDGGPKRHP